MSSPNSSIYCDFSSSASLTGIVITSDSSMISSNPNPVDSTQRLIKYDVMINRPNNYRFPEISFDDIDKYDFNSHSFIEVIKSPDYVHLYFDFDSLLTLEEKQREKDNKNKAINEIIITDDEQLKRFDTVIQWLGSLKPVFGEYSLGGYTSNEDIKNKYHLRLYKEGNHFISVHVVYYQTMLKASELEEIMKHTAKQGFIYDGINQFADPNVYSIVKHDNGKGGTRKFRHVLSDKIFTTNKNDKYNKSNKSNHGFIINDLKPSTQIIQVRGDEKIINRNEWSNLFKQR